MSAANDRTPLAILVVEDEGLLRRTIAAFLREAGCLVTEAVTAEQALAFIDKPLDAVITDLHLGGRLNGWDVGEAFRKARNDLPVIYVTGDIIEPPRPVPRSALFPKPYDPEEILEACHKLSGTA